MLQLASTDLLEVITALNGSIKAHVSWVDFRSSPESVSPGRTNTVISTASTATILASPSSGFLRNVRYVCISNADTTARVPLQVVQTDGSNPVPLWNGTLFPNDCLICTSKGDWQYFSSGGIVVENPHLPIDVQVFTTPIRATWVKPAGARVVLAIVFGAGGGGAWAGNATSCGGAGGGGGAYASRYFLADDLLSNEIVQVGRGGRAGANLAATSNGTQGNGSFFGFVGSPVIRRCAAGGGGGGFGNSSGNGGGGGGGTDPSANGNGAVPTNNSTQALGGTPTNGSTPPGWTAGSGATGVCPGFTNTGVAEFGGGGGGGAIGGSAAVSTNGGSSLRGGAGGGGGGGYNSGTPFAVQAPAAGSASNTLSLGTGGAAGTSGASPTNGADGANGNSAVGGAGGGGGGSTIAAATNGANGGKGGSHGGGGGGGGASQNGTGGNGGLGGDGAVYVFSW